MQDILAGVGRRACFIMSWEFIRFGLPILHIFLLINLLAYGKIDSWGATENGKRFAFRRNEYILRASSIFGSDTNGKYSERYIMMFETIVGIVGIVVTIISIVVTVISIIQTGKKHKQQKSNRQVGCFFKK